MKITKEQINAAEQAIINNCIDADEAKTVLDEKLYPEEETDDSPKTQKFTFRFHTHGWTDITVEAEDEEEAEELASDKYNNGDYDDSDSDFENTDVENVTDYYIDNNIPQ